MSNRKRRGGDNWGGFFWEILNETETQHAASPSQREVEQQTCEVVRGLVPVEGKL
jgi:hypothetical protein